MPRDQAYLITSGEDLDAGPTASLDDVPVDQEAVQAWIKLRTIAANVQQTAVVLLDDLLEPPPLDIPSVLTRKTGRTSPPRARQVVIQEFEGRVVSISQKEGLFAAYLTDVTSGSDDESEDVDLPVEDISDTDLPLFEEGAIFRWLIGYRYQGTTKERFSKLVFRRIPAWSARRREEIWKKAEERANALKWD